MRFTFVPLTCLALLLLASPVMAKEKKQDKQMDPQAMMEVWKQLATPGEPHKLFATLAGRGRSSRLNGIRCCETRTRRNRNESWQRSSK